jgi:hypothetical protein
MVMSIVIPDPLWEIDVWRTTNGIVSTWECELKFAGVTIERFTAIEDSPWKTDQYREILDEEDALADAQAYFGQKMRKMWNHG